MLKFQAIYCSLLSGIVVVVVVVVLSGIMFMICACIIILSTDIFCFRNADPEPNPPYFSTSVVRATFDYLTQKHSAHASSCVMLLARTQVMDPVAVPVVF